MDNEEIRRRLEGIDKKLELVATTVGSARLLIAHFRNALQQEDEFQGSLLDEDK